MAMKALRHHCHCAAAMTIGQRTCLLAIFPSTARRRGWCLRSRSLSALVCDLALPQSGQLTGPSRSNPNAPANRYHAIGHRFACRKAQLKRMRLRQKVAVVTIPSTIQRYCALIAIDQNLICYLHQMNLISKIIQCTFEPQRG